MGWTTGVHFPARAMKEMEAFFFFVTMFGLALGPPSLLFNGTGGFFP
jgi:hypothetical protein